MLQFNSQIFLNISLSDVFIIFVKKTLSQKQISEQLYKFKINFVYNKKITANKKY